MVINSIRNKTDLLADIIKSNVDILMKYESILDDSFRHGHFVTEGFGTPFLLDRNITSGGIKVFIWSDIATKVASTDRKSS